MQSVMKKLGEQLGARIDAVERRVSQGPEEEPEDAKHHLGGLMSTLSRKLQESSVPGVPYAPPLLSGARAHLGTAPRARGVPTPAERDRIAEKASKKQLDAARPYACERLAPALLDNMLREGRGKVEEYVRLQPVKKDRDAHECRRIAQMLDALLESGIDLSHDAVEMGARNIAGLLLADAHERHDLIEQMELLPPASIVPRAILRNLIKDADRATRFKKGGKGK